MKYPNATIAYCIEQVVGNYRTAAEVSRETGCSEQIIGKWLDKHWFGSRSKDDFEVKQSKINTDNDDNTSYHTFY